MHYRLSRKYGVYIPRKTKIGYGLRIWHAVGIVINPDTVIGNRCQFHQFLSIGNTADGAPKIGDNVWIGPNVSIFGDITIGNNVKIGAGSVIFKNVPDNATVVGINRIILK